MISRCRAAAISKKKLSRRDGIQKNVLISKPVTGLN
jgi:hypothetical protein